jgi:hypothetical protein
MRDSEQPCFITLLPHLVAARPCFDQPKRQQDPEIISLLRTCLSLSMRWICAPRKRSERDALMRRSCRCPASVRSTPAHQSILPDHSWPCMAVISELLEAVEGAYTPALRRMQPHTLRLDRLTSHSPWPQSIGEILPHGAEDTIRGLFSWIDADFGKADALCIVRGLDTILAFTRPLTLPYVVTSRALLSRCIIPLIDQACAAAQLRIVVPPAKPDRAVVLPAQQKLFSILPVALGSIACILANYADEEQRRVLLGNMGHQLLAACERACSIHITDRDPEAVRQSIAHLSIIARVIIRCEPQLARAPPSALRHVLAPHRPRSAWEDFCELLSHLHAAQRCAAPTCTAVVADRALFKRCGGCRRVTYCSRRCQARGWRHPAVPHRTICAALRNLCTVCADARANRQGGRARPKSLDEDSVRLVLGHFFARTRYELAHSGRMPRICLGARAHPPAAAYRSEADWIASIEAR